MGRHVRLLVLLTTCCMLLWGHTARAQSLEVARESYRSFLSRYNAGGVSSSAFEALLTSYKSYAALIESGIDAAVVEEGKEVLRDIRPYLQHGAVFYSRQRTPQAQATALVFARAYVDIPLMKEFRGEPFRQDAYYPTMVYFAASGCYNARDYANAIRYFREYVATGATEKKRDILLYMVNAYQQIEDLPHASRVLEEAVAAYPSDFELLSKAINVAIDTKDNEALQGYVTQALALRPDDRTLLNIQAKLYEDTGRYAEAVECYTRLRNANPQSLSYAKHLALNYYNLGVLYNNMSLERTDAVEEKRYADKSATYFSLADPIVNDILHYDPSSLQYLEIKATIDRSLGRKEDQAETNRKIASLGGQTVSDTDVPSLLSYDRQPAAQPAADRPAAASLAQETTAADVWEDYNGIPPYSAYAKQYVESRINAWQVKDPYETVSEYRQRVSEKTRNAKIKDLLQEAEANYIDRYAQSVRISDLRLRPYDAEHEVFLAESDYGEVIIPVPRANNEARIFESSWNGVRLVDPSFRVVNDKLTISGLTFITPTGKNYRYDDKGALDYTETVVDIRFDPIDYGELASTDNNSRDTERVRKSKIKLGKSDVDMNIPQTEQIDEKTFAVIIANENYEMVAGVPMALNDGRTFSLYCEKTLGLPKKNIRLYEDATYGSMLRAVRDIEHIASAYNGDIRVLFYYAGHGIPNETTKDAYLLPVDADGLQTEVCYSLNKLYTELGRLNAQSVIVFLDACFSGAQRDSDSRMLASARGIALRAKRETPQGNMVIFSAASGDETAFPYTEKGHGLFTYYLLKKLQETQGNVTLAELGAYITEHVKQQSVVTNRKPQTPNISASLSMDGIWQEMRLRPLALLQEPASESETESDGQLQAENKE